MRDEVSDTSDDEVSLRDEDDELSPTIQDCEAFKELPMDKQ